MKKLHLLHLFISCVVIGNAQNGLQLRIYIDPGTVPGFKQTINIRGYLINESNNVVNITRPTPYALWRTDKDYWLLSKNGQFEKPFKFVERPDRKFLKKDLLDLKPHDSIAVSFYQWQLGEDGTYQIQLQYEQQKANIDKTYVNEKLLADRQDFKLESNIINLNIKKPQAVAIKELLPYGKLMFSELFWDGNPAPAYARPNDVYRLQLAKGTNYKTFTECKNVQFLTVADMNLDSIPQAMAQWDLQYLDMVKGTESPFLYFPPDFCKNGNLKFLHLLRGFSGSLPDWIFYQKKAEDVRILVTSLKELDARFGEMVAVKKMEIGNFENTEVIPSSFSKLVNVEELSIMGKNLRDLGALEFLPKLKLLTIRGQYITKDNEVLKRMKSKNKELLIFTDSGMVM